MNNRCTCCRALLSIAESGPVKPVCYVGMLYGLMFNCPACMSTQFHVLWRLPDEMLDEEDVEVAA
jgi:hypothetical protein